MPNENVSNCITSKNTLVIEDDPAIRETLKLVLEMEGYQVFTASNGKEGIELLRDIPKPCIILLDLMMPVMNGWEFVEAIEKDVILATIPVVVVSAFTDRTKTIKATDVIKKPVDLSALLKILQDYCGKE